MKTIRFSLIALALALSIGGAIASSFVTAITVYEFIDEPGTVEDDCVPYFEQECSTVGVDPCTISGVATTLRQNSNPAPQTECGQELFRAE